VALGLCGDTVRSTPTFKEVVGEETLREGTSKWGKGEERKERRGHFVGHFIFWMKEPFRPNRGEKWKFAEKTRTGVVKGGQGRVDVRDQRRHFPNTRK